MPDNQEEIDREDSAIGDGPSKFDLWRDEQGLDSDSKREDLSDALGQDLLQSYLEMAYANYIRQSTRNLIGHIYKSSPLVGRHRIAEEANDEQTT